MSIIIDEMKQFDYDKALEYWSGITPEDRNYYENYKSEAANIRSFFLCGLINDIIDLDFESKICEIGCNAKRNLHFLEKNGYTNLYGFDINKDALKNGYKVKANIKNCSVVEYFPAKEKFDLVFSMAVLQHFPYEIDYIFEDIAKSTKYLLTIEDEGKQAKRTFSRNYKDVFEGVGMTEINNFRPYKIHGIGKTFIVRLFEWI